MGLVSCWPFGAVNIIRAYSRNWRQLRQLSGVDTGTPKLRQAEKPKNITESHYLHMEITTIFDTNKRLGEVSGAVAQLS